MNVLKSCDCLSIIFDNCELKDCLRFSSVCKQWLKLLSEKRLYAALISLKRERELFTTSFGGKAPYNTLSRYNVAAPCHSGEVGRLCPFQEELTCTYYSMSDEQCVYNQNIYCFSDTDDFYDSFY